MSGAVAAAVVLVVFCALVGCVAGWACGPGLRVRAFTWWVGAAMVWAGFALAVAWWVMGARELAARGLTLGGTEVFISFWMASVPALVALALLAPVSIRVDDPDGGADSEAG